MATNDSAVTAMAGHILQRREGAVAEIRICNPAKLNAMSLAMWQSLGAAVRELAGDTSVRVLLLRGEGDKAFVSGADIAEFDSQRSAESGSEVYDQAVEEAQAALQATPFPVVACVHGVCMGGGLGLAMACDLRYAAQDARLRMPAARLGLGYSYSGIRRMVEQIGPANTADIFYTARTFDGREAERLGIVHRAWPVAELDDEVTRMVSVIAANAPLTLRLAKSAISLASAGAPVEAAVALERARQRCVRSRDYAEGRRAFAEKRSPLFIGE